MNQKAKIFFLFFIGFYFSFFKISAQELIFKGNVKNEKGELISFVNVFCLNEKAGTHTNENGDFELKLKPGKHEIRFHSIDYQTQIIQVELKEDLKVPVEIVLKQQVYELTEFNVKANQKNTADFIMRKAIAAAPYYRRQVLAYQARVYLKGTGKVDKIPLLLRGTLSDQNIKEGVTMLTESVNELSFSQPSTYKEKVISLKSSYKSNEGPQPMSMVRGNWYNTSSTELISPLSPQAFSVYHFELLGTFYEEGREVNKIKITPKRKGRDLYKGTIFIIDGLWCLHSVDVSYESNSLDVSTKIRFEPVNGHNFVWLPQTYDFQISGSFFGVSGSFRYLASISNYKIKINPNLDHSYFIGQGLKGNIKELSPEVQEFKPEPVKSTKRQKDIEKLLQKENLSKFEMLRLTSKLKAESDLLKNNPNVIDSSEMVIDSLAEKRDSVFWNENRPIVLLESEVKSYEKFQKKGNDSTALKPKKRNYTDMFLYGDSILSKSKKYYFKFDSPLSGTKLNSIDAWSYSLKFAFGTNNPDGKNFSMSNKIVFPLERKAVYGNVLFDYCQKPFSFRHFKVDVGSLISDFNQTGAGDFVDAFYLLFYKRNMVKMYQEDYLKLSYSETIYRGLNIETNLLFSDRSKLEINPRLKSNIGLNSEYTLNVPQLETNGLIADFEPNRALIFNFLINYKPSQYYRIKGRVREAFYNSKPMFSMKYTQAISGVLGANNDFSKLEFGISQNSKPLHWLGINYRLKLGKILSANTIYFPDYFMHAGNRSWILKEDLNERFMNLGYYEYSNKSSYLSAQLNFTLKRFLLLRLPILNLTKIKENIYFNFIQIPEKEIYYELGYGLSNISQIIDIGVFSNFQANTYRSTELRLSISIPGFIRN
jgi:hypothetical protein